VVDGVGDRRDPGDANLSRALGPERVDVRIVLLDEEGVDCRDVGMVLIPR
jgi:hypothetical protein